MTYSEQDIVAAINRAVEECNHFVSTKDVVSEVTGLQLYNPLLKKININERRLLAKRITDYMSVRYELYSQNARGPTWRVK